VRTEIAKARKREKEDKRVLFPVRLVSYEAMQSWEYIDSSGTDLAEEIRQYFVPDFSQWKEHDSYQGGAGEAGGGFESRWVVNSKNNCRSFDSDARQLARPRSG
jgi:hypothetical protein